MDIRFVSSLTPDDENRLAPALLDAVGGILDQLPIAYTLRIETAAGKGFAHNHVPDGMAPTVPVPGRADGSPLSLSGVGGNGHQR